MNHTPGPWTWFNYPDGRKLLAAASGAVIHCVDAPVTCDQADQDLIAAAPELLAALEEYVEWFGAVHGEDCPVDDTCTCIGGGLNARVNAAIAKAEGR